MRAVGFTESRPAADPRALEDLALPDPEPAEHDLLVDVEAVSVNPVDTKVRLGSPPSDGQPRVLGWDASGTVKAVGPAVTLFKPGDRVWYAGSIARPGCDSERHVVDERITGPHPRTLAAAEAAALPLTSITAWELLFDRLGFVEGQGEGLSLLVVGAAGGVGSILVQLARTLTKATVIGTASRPETAEWVKALGAHHVIDHARPLSAELKRIGIPEVTHAASLTRTDLHYAELVESLAPQGRLGLIDDPPTLDAKKLKRKSLSLHWELMFTRPLYGTPDLVEQHRLLVRVAQMVDAGRLKTTLGEHYGRINAANLRRAHALVESGRARGKIVLEGFGE